MLQNMIGKSSNQRQRNLFAPLLTDFIDIKHELVLLAEKIDSKHLEKELSIYYSHTGQPSMPIRFFMVGCLMLKRIYNLGDETLAQAWIMNPYMQYFCGQSNFQHHFPCDPSDFVHFRKRIGEAGIEKIFVHSVELHGSKAKGKTLLSDTTVQENIISFPTDSKQAKSVIDKCNKIAETENVIQRQTYKRIAKQLLRDSYNSTHPKRRKKAKKVHSKLRTLAGRQLCELERELSPETLAKYKSEFEIYRKVITQQKTDKNKIYSIHKPYTACIAKGKAHKQYEFGNKIGLMVNPKNLVILGIESFSGNPHDSHTIEPLLDQIKNNLNYQPKEIIYDRGGKGKAMINEVKISTPRKPSKRDTVYQKRSKQKKFRGRAAIEPVIGHLKQHFRMGQNYLSGPQSAKNNSMLAATGWNLKKLMKKLAENIFSLFQKLFFLEINLFFTKLKLG